MRRPVPEAGGLPRLAHGQAPAQARRHPGRTQRNLRQLADTIQRLATGRQFFLGALELLCDPRTFYEQGGTSLKRAMNKVIFTKLFVDGEEITGHKLAEAEQAAYRWNG